MNGSFKRIVNLKGCVAGIWMFALSYTIWMSSIIRTMTVDHPEEVLHSSQPDQEETIRRRNILFRENKDRLGPIFYSVFIPMEEEGKKLNALRIVQEQMDQRRQYDSDLRSVGVVQSPVWYTLIESGTNNTNNNASRRGSGSNTSMTDDLCKTPLSSDCLSNRGR